MKFWRFVKSKLIGDITNTFSWNQYLGALCARVLVNEISCKMTTLLVYQFLKS